MNYDLETALEDTLIQLISECTEIKTIRWENIKNVNFTSNNDSDVIKVRVSFASEEPGTYNLYAGINLIVDIAVFGSNRRDIDGRATNKTRGIIRSVFAQSDIVDRINAIGNIAVYDNGVIPINTFDSNDDKNYGKGITLQIVARPI